MKFYNFVDPIKTIWAKKEIDSLVRDRINGDLIVVSLKDKGRNATHFFVVSLVDSSFVGRAQGMSWCNGSLAPDWTSGSRRTMANGTAASDVISAVASSLAHVDEPWNRVVKLLVLSAVASVASVANVFVISAVLMEDHLKKRGESSCFLLIEFSLPSHVFFHSLLEAFIYW